jgi:hypothetical protein
MKRIHVGGSFRTLVATGALLAIAAALAGACNYHWYPYGTTYQLSRVEVAGAFPAVKKKVQDPVKKGEVERWVRVCEGEVEPEGVIFNVNFVGTQTDKPDQFVGDMDVSMRPGDVVKTTGQKTATQHRFVLEEDYTIRAEDFDVYLECLDPYPDVDGQCDATHGVAAPGGVQRQPPSQFRYAGLFAPDQDGFYKRTFNEDNSMGVAVLIDQSGSMKGYVDKDSFVEVTPTMTKAWNGSAFGMDASDKNNQRLAAVAQLLSAQTLNAKDKAIVFQYGEKVSTEGAKVVCYNPSGATEEQLRRECFGTNRDLVLTPPTGQDQSELDKLQPLAKGRTPLWAAVKDVYQFMQCPRNDDAGACVPTKVSHVIVIGDGPDTCAEDSPDFLPKVVYRTKTTADSPREVGGQGKCSNVGYDEVRDLVKADLADPTKHPVHFSFIQFQSKGYVERDPLQQEFACLTGGQYVFLNTQYGGIGGEGGSTSSVNEQALEAVLKNAVMKVRNTLAGTWEMGVNLPDLTSSVLPRGAQIALWGVITLKYDQDKENNLSLTDKMAMIGVGATDIDEELAEAGGLPKFDRRPAVRLPCGAGDSCDWYPLYATAQEVQSVPPYFQMFDGCHPKACGDTTMTCGVGHADATTACTTPTDPANPGVCCGQGCWAGATECK